jgi:hypothetical protein
MIRVMEFKDEYASLVTVALGSKRKSNPNVNVGKIRSKFVDIASA